MVNVTLSGSFLSNQSQVTDVELSNLDLKQQMASLPALLPPNISLLWLDNVLLYELPWKQVAALPTLTSL